MTRYSSSSIRGGGRGGISASLALCLFLLQSITLATLGHLRHGHRHHEHHDHDHHHDHAAHRRASGLVESDFDGLVESDFVEGGDDGDIFDSCFVACYEDIVDRYGVEFADQLRADGFHYKTCETDNSTTVMGGGGDAVYADSINGTVYANSTNGTAVSGQQRALHRILGATNQLYRLWTVPDYRGADGKLHIPYAIKAATTWFTAETYDTIRLAMETIENATGVIKFVPRTATYGVQEHIYFNHDTRYERACAANLGKQYGQRTNVYLGWCKGRRHLGNIVHELLHALGFWHEHSRPDRDAHVTIALDLIAPAAHNNFAKATMVNSLGSPYDFNSIMHYPPVSFSLDGRTPTIIPVEPLERWETMGQRAQLSPHDIEQLRLLYQCASGPRMGDLTVDELCSTDCPCWEHAMGECHGDDDECMGDLVCGPTPNPLPTTEHKDKLEYYGASGGTFSCNEYCHLNCCGYANSKILCPETCGSAPPEEPAGAVPTQMCVKGDVTEPRSGGGTTSSTAATTTTTTTTTTTSLYGHPYLPWYVKWGIDRCVQFCDGPAPCGGTTDQVQQYHFTVQDCCKTWLSYKEFDDCHTAPEGSWQSEEPTTSPTKGPTAAPVTESPSDSPSTSVMPTTAPSTNPSYGPTITNEPSMEPTAGPTTSPTMEPTKGPSSSPTMQPTKGPSRSPTANPSDSPVTEGPSPGPTEQPTDSPVVKPAASGVWYVDWDLNKCVQDCLGERPCRNRRKESWERGYRTVKRCCNTMSYVPFEECTYEPVLEMRGGGGETDTKWYPTAATCVNDGNAPAWQHNKHGTQSACCRSHFNWEYNDCMGITPTGSRKWFMDWARGKCVRDCDEGEGGACGGLVPGSWAQTHDDANACCGAHMSYAPVAECKFDG